MSYLDLVNSPDDLKKMNMDEMKVLADEIRQAILNRDSKIGGHVGPNLGIVETTIALHYVFDTPRDKIVWDVSHQCYPHKMLTGRKEGFLTAEGMAKISGYTNQDESEHDFFKVGHTSTSVSLACGLAKARDLLKQKHNVIAVIGDGSLSGGEAMEGFNNAAVLDSNIIIIVNDNEMSIAENHGGLYKNLHLLRETKGQAECNMFKALGFEYLYVDDGNNLADMIAVLKKVKDVKVPLVLHIHTLKGMGYELAEKNKEQWHWNFPFDIKTGKTAFEMPEENYNDITYDYLEKKIAKDKSIIVVNAATSGVFGLSPERRAKLGENFVDVGIAEEHGVAFTSALAKGGCKPIFMVMSSFVQRTYDQLSQDLALNENPAVVLVGWGGISGADMTHLCTFDIPLISNIPNLVYLAPVSVEEYSAMLEWAIEQKKYSVVIRMPNRMLYEKNFVEDDYSEINKYKIMQKGEKTAIIAAGSFYGLALEVADKMPDKPTIINPRYLTGVDEKCLENLEKDHSLVITLEDGEIDGGFGEKIARFYGPKNMKVLNFGAKKEFSDRVNVNKLYERYHLTPELIVADIEKVLK